MRKLLTILLILSASVCFGQAWNTGQVKPSTAASVQAPENATIHINKLDTIAGIRLGSMGYYAIPSITTLKKYRLKSDTVNLKGTFSNFKALSKINISEKGANNGVATLDAGGKIPFTQLPASLMIMKGTWSALTNTPTLTDGIGVAGWVYRNNLAGTVNFGSGNISFRPGDWVIYNGTNWQWTPGSDAVSSVNGQQGIVTLNTSHIPENTNLYFTDARARSAVGSSLTNGFVPNATPNGLTNSPIRTDNTNIGIELFAVVSSGTFGRSLNFRPSLVGTLGDPSYLYNLSISSEDLIGGGAADGLSINAYGGVSFSTGSNSRLERMRINNLGKVIINSLASANPHLLLSSPSGQLTPITNAVGYAKNDGNGNITFDTQGFGWNYTPQPLFGTTIAYDVSIGINANLTLSGNTTINMSNVQAGMVGNITIVNNGTARQITFNGYTFNISQKIRGAANMAWSGATGTDQFTWSFDGVRISITGEYNLQ